ncbi:MAG: DNA mismatch endonuclease Vsr [Muribaculaceae bacterium]|nr:DNA mismatch endonuclease Vsr [Muribaculaceae bacterium]MBQ2484779.1 DNA mismatch endonuclease Vsr [Muribaculaceae bacterium]
MDKMTREQRHRCMSSVRSKDTRPEMVVRRYLWQQGFHYRLHDRSLPGSPDIVLRRLRAVVLVNGCFWHGHEGCAKFRLPQSNTPFWRTKIARNRARDYRNTRLLRWMGWHVFVVWECQLEGPRREATLASLSLSLSRLTLRQYAIGDDTLIAAEPTP